jgi:acyl-CoA thioester hydrolase
MTTTEYISAEVIIEVPFHDVDIMNIVWHGHYSKYFEIARCKLLDKIDYNYVQMKESGYAWPVIDHRLRYIKPARFQQKICVKATIIEWENRLRISYLVTDQTTGEKLTKGRTDMVAVKIATEEMQFASPDILLQKIGIETN